MKFHKILQMRIEYESRMMIAQILDKSAKVELLSLTSLQSYLNINSPLGKKVKSMASLLLELKFI